MPTYTQLRPALYALTIILYLINAVAHLTWLNPVLSAFSLVAILVSLPACSWPTRILTTIFLATGTLLLWAHQVSWSAQLSAFGGMLYLLALFAIVPVLTVPIFLGGYGHAMELVLRGRVRSAFQLNCLVTTLSFLCGAFVNMAAVPILMASMDPAVQRARLSNRVRFTTVSATYGYVLSILWTPVSGVVGLVISTVHIEWLALLPELLMLSLAGLVGNWMIFHLLEPGSHAALDEPVATNPCGIVSQPAADPAPARQARGETSPRAKLLQLLVWLLLLLIAMGAFERLVREGFTTIVTLASAPFAFFWCAAIGKRRPFLGEARRQLQKRLVTMSDPFAVFLSVGFFTSALHLSRSDSFVNAAFLGMRDVLGPQSVLLVMPVMALGLSFVGVHPLTAIAVLGDSLRPEILGVTSTQLAITLVGGAALTYLLGPFSGTLGLVQSIAQTPTFRLARWNAPYACGLLVLLVIAILITH